MVFSSFRAFLGSFLALGAGRRAALFFLRGFLCAFLFVFSLLFCAFLGSFLALGAKRRAAPFSVGLFVCVFVCVFSSFRLFWFFCTKWNNQCSPCLSTESRPHSHNLYNDAHDLASKSAKSGGGPS